MGLLQKINKNVRTHILSKIPFVGHYLKDLHMYSSTFGPGHYYSPIVSLDEVKSQPHLFEQHADHLPGINMNIGHQLALLEQIKQYYAPPFELKQSDKRRYYYENDFFSWSDAIFLYSLLRHYRPKRVIEVGSGFSSALMLDVNDAYLDHSVSFTFIEPFPNRLLKLLSETDKQNCTIIDRIVQDVDPKIFLELEENDILFIDSSHVSKTGSDVNHLLFNILPLLKKGVLIHVHDITYPFEYPKQWVFDTFKGFGWNEAYILRSFLMHNEAYIIECFGSYLQQFHRAWFEQHMPLCLKSIGGSIWLRKQ